MTKKEWFDILITKDRNLISLHITEESIYDFPYGNEDFLIDKIINVLENSMDNLKDEYGCYDNNNIYENYFSEFIDSVIYKIDEVLENWKKYEEFKLKYKVGDYIYDNRYLVSKIIKIKTNGLNIENINRQEFKAYTNDIRLSTEKEINIFNTYKHNINEIRNKKALLEYEELKLQTEFNLIMKDEIESKYKL